MKKAKWILSAIGLFSVLYLFGETQDQNTSPDIYDNLDLFANSLAIIQRDYVEPVEPQKLIYGALKGMMKALDPHSQFLDPQAHQEIEVETEGRFGGLGIEITVQDDFLTVVSAIEGTPAAVAGIFPKDRIVKIDGKSTKDMSLEEAVKLLRGKPATKIKLTILRSKKKKVLEFDLERAVIKIESIAAAQMLEDHIGYVRISEFQERTASDLGKALEKFKQDAMEGLILDLRNNPGGLLQAGVDVAEKFIKKDSLIVYTKGRKPSQNLSFKSKRDPITDVPLVILVNEGSASASEIVAGAIQDLKRGVVVGKKTFGKGSVQSVIPLKDGSALKLTTAKYFTPNGRSIQGTGVEPDISVALPPKETLKLREEARKKILEGQAKPIVRDRQFQSAFDILRGVRIFQKVSGAGTEEHKT